MKVAVGSKNPVKIKAVERVFRIHFPEAKASGVEVDSEVAEQPMSEEEMYQGSVTRAKKALNKILDAAYGVGIEGGIHQYPYGWCERSLVVVLDRQGREGVGASGGLRLPHVVVERIHAGENLEEVIDDLFGTEKVGRGIGMFGVFTKKAVTRQTGTEHGVAFALARFLHPGLFD